MRVRGKLILAGILALVILPPVSTIRAEWTEPILLNENVNAPGRNYSPDISPDGQRLYFSSSRAGTIGDEDIWYCDRDSTTQDWGAAVNLGPGVNTYWRERSPAVSSDGRSIYFSSFRPGDNGSWDIWVCEWDDTLQQFGQAALLDSSINSFCTEWTVDISRDQQTLWVSSSYERPKDNCSPTFLQVSHWDSLSSTWSVLEPPPWSPKVSPETESPTFSADDSLIIFACWCSLGADLPCWQGESDLYAGHFEGDTLVVDVNLCAPLNSEYREYGPSLSADGKTLYFDSRRNTGENGPEQIFVSYWIEDTLYVDETESPVLPEALDIEQNYPNPFNASTVIEFSLPRGGEVSLEIVNALGQKIDTLVDGWLSNGQHRSTWDGCDWKGEPVASGVYFYVLRFKGAQASKKMILLK